MCVVLGLPENVRTSILGEIVSADSRQFKLALSTTVPTPPTEALELFVVADEVTRVSSGDSLWYTIGSS